MSKKHQGNKGFANKKEREASSKAESDKILDDMLGPIGTPARDEAEANMANAKMSSISVEEAFNLNRKKQYPNLDVRIFFDSENKEGEYTCDLAGSPAELARALFALSVSDPMYEAIITSVHDQLMRKKEYDKLKPINYDNEKN